MKASKHQKHYYADNGNPLGNYVDVLINDDVSRSFRKSSRQPSPSKPTSLQCTYCKEMISSELQKCPNCGHWIKMIEGSPIRSRFFGGQSGYANGGSQFQSGFKFGLGFRSAGAVFSLISWFLVAVVIAVLMYIAFA